LNKYDVMCILGNGAAHEVLTEAGVDSADLLIAYTPMDELNILCCMVAKKLGAKDSIARVRTPEYFTLFQGKELGLSMLVNPEYETALGIARLLRHSAVISIEPFADGQVELAEIKVSPESGLDGIMLKDLQAQFIQKFLVCIVLRKEQTIIPDGNLTLIQGDRIYLTASKNDMSPLLAKLTEDRWCRRVMIIGGNRVAYYLAQELEKSSVDVKIIEINPDKCRRLSQLLHKPNIILGDGTNQELLLEEDIDSMDAVVCQCGLDEQNIILAMYAHSLNVKRVVANVDKADYYKMLQNTEVDSVVSTKRYTADQIVRYVRDKHGRSGINKLSSIIGDKAEAVEFTVENDFGALNIPLKNIKTIPNLLLAAIIRNKVTIIPSGDDYLQQGDRVLVVTTSRGLSNLNSILD